MKTLTAINTLKVEHQISYKGLSFTVKGDHELKFAPVSKLRFFVYLGTSGINYTPDKHEPYYSLSFLMDYLIDEAAKKVERDAYYAKRQGLTTEQILTHPDFAYARFKTGGLGDYYHLYLKDIHSPTGVSQAGGCSVEEWERLSKATGNEHNYLSPTEDLRTAR